MLFNSFEFLFLFLPISLIIFFLIGKVCKNNNISILWLVCVSLFFYGWWDPKYLYLILLSISINYNLAGFLQSSLSLVIKKIILYFGVICNLSSIAYFKYANFFVFELNNISSLEIHLDNIVLPLAISFFTFQQIAYLVDSYRGEISEQNFLLYMLFVTFFPQLIAGPIVHHREMLPQFRSANVYKFNEKFIVLGISLFTIGLFKKLIVADSMAMFATPIFQLANNLGELSILDAWKGALAYTFQLYFDFSGYSDMAIGLALLIGIRLPLNFNSPYKALSIVDFWRRWHITLSRFLRDYLYITLGGSRVGFFRRYSNLMLTMLIGGLWHGAGWTFIIWGGLHGFYLIINHIFNYLTSSVFKINLNGSIYRFSCWTLTFISVVVAWVFFRAESFDAALHLTKAMVDVSSFPKFIDIQLFFTDSKGWVLSILQLINGKESEYEQGIFLFIIIATIFCKFSPNSTEIVNKIYDACIHKNLDMVTKLDFPSLSLSRKYLSPILLGGVFSWCILNLNKVSEFLYFQF